MAKKIYQETGGWFLEAYSVMTNFHAKGTNSFANRMNSIAKAINSIAKACSIRTEGRRLEFNHD